MQRRFHLRAYQEKAFQDIRGRFEAGERIVDVEMPVGSGKSYVMAAVAQMFVAAGKKVVVLVTRRELGQQYREHLDRCELQNVQIEFAFCAGRWEPADVVIVPDIPLNRIAIFDKAIREYKECGAAVLTMKTTYELTGFVNPNYSLGGGGGDV